MRQLSFTQAVYEAQKEAMDEDSSVIILGLGVNYPNGIDGTSGDLGNLYPDRVLDTPVSENCIGGVTVGLGISKMRPIFVNQRVEFALFAIDSIATQASKFFSMLGGVSGHCNSIFRIQTGRAWGHASQHTSQYFPFFANITGLNVVVPSTPKVAKGLIKSALKHSGPVVILESRWLLGIKESFEEEEISLTESRYIQRGKDVTLVSYGEGIIDCLKAAKKLNNLGIECEIVDLISINPIDASKVIESFKKTNKLCIFETTNSPCSVGSYLIKFISDLMNHLSCVSILNTPHEPTPARPEDLEYFYPTYVDIVNQSLLFFNKNPLNIEMTFEELHFGPKLLLNDFF